MLSHPLIETIADFPSASRHEKSASGMSRGIFDAS
jgi:hypothetical protein